MLFFFRCRLITGYTFEKGFDLDCFCFRYVCRTHHELPMGEVLGPLKLNPILLPWQIRSISGKHVSWLMSTTRLLGMSITIAMFDLPSS